LDSVGSEGIFWVIYGRQSHGYQTIASSERELGLFRSCVATKSTDKWLWVISAGKAL
jgi:hypothetical protein